MDPSPIQRLAGRVPRRWRRVVPTRLRNAIVGRLGHPPERFDPASHPRRLNLGAGYDKRAGYLNVDFQAFHGPDLVGDVRSLPELPSGYYEEIVAQDVLEHLERAEVTPALQEWRRLLAPGGRLWLRVPDLPSLLRWLSESEDTERHRKVLHLLFGTQAYKGDYHLAGFTDVLLCEELLAIGLGRVELERRDDWLWEGGGQLPGPGDAAPRLALAWGRGFFQREPGVDGGGWRWAEPRAELLLFAAEAVTAELELRALHGTATITGAGAARTLEPGTNRLAFALPAGPTRLTLTASTGEEQGERDGRVLAVQLDADHELRGAQR